MSHLSERPDTHPDDYAVAKAVPHEAAALHVTGPALYTDDLVARTTIAARLPGAVDRRKARS